MRVSQPVRPIARLAIELQVTGIGQLVVGVGGLAGALAINDSPARVLVPYAVVFVFIAAASTWGSRWMRAAEPGGAAPGVRVETTGLTVRRCLVGLAVAIVAVVATLLVTGALAAVLGGVVAAVGAVDLVNLAWARGRERETGLALYRELGSSPFSSGRRPLYTRPRNDMTLAT